MLQIIVPPIEEWNESKQEFVYLKGCTLQLEHSLVSISKWESKWNKVFLSKREKTTEEVLDYIRCMTITQNVNPEIYMRLTDENIKQINEYIEAPMTATYFSEDSTRRTSREQVTSELIYYWMISFNIPLECQKWHLNRLLTLIKVCNIKNQPPKKKNTMEIMSRNAALNEARKKQLNTKG